MKPGHLIVASVAGLLALACTSVTGSAAAQAATGESCQALAQKYPGLRGRAIVVGISPAPASYSATDPNDPSNIIGIEPDLLHAAGECLGFTVSYAKLDFGGLIPALQSGRINLIAAGMYASDERAKKVSFVEYMKAGEASLVRAGNPKKLASLADVCDVTAAEVLGTVENAILDKQSAACAQAGKPPITPLQFQSVDRAYSGLAQGRADIFLTDAGVASYLAAAAPDKVAVGFAIPSEFVFGLGVNKSDTELLEGLNASFTEQYQSGAMKAALHKWGFADSQLHEPAMKTR